MKVKIWLPTFTCLVLSLWSLKTAAQTVRLLGISTSPNTTLELQIFTTVSDKLWANHGIKLEVELMPAHSRENYANRLTTLLRSNNTEFDLYMMDVTAVGEYHDKFVEIEVDQRDHIQGVLESSHLNGRQLAVPYFLDFGIVYYRKDLLMKHNFTRPPNTWDEMETMMRKILDEEVDSMPGLYGYIGQFIANEEIVSNIIEWLGSIDAGHIIEKNKTITVGNQRAVDMFYKMKSWLFKKYAPWVSLLLNEENSLEYWLDGNAIFHRSRFSIQSKAKSSPKFRESDVGIARLPGATSNQTASTLYGWALAVNSQSRNVTASAQVVKFLTSSDFQMERSLLVGGPPTLRSLYDDPEYCKLNDHCDLFKSLHLISRPSAVSGAQYPLAVEQIAMWATKIFQDTITVEEGLANLTKSLQAILRIEDFPSPKFIRSTGYLGLGFQVIAAALSLSSIILFFTIWWNKQHKILRTSSPMFMLTMVIGTHLAYSSVFVYTGEPTHVKCILQPWLLVMAFSVTVSALLAKNWRVYRIFREKYSVDMTISDTNVLQVCAGLVIVDVIILALWTIIDPPKPTLVSYTETSNFWTCRSTNNLINWAFISFLIFYSSTLMGFGVFLAYSTRNVKSQYNESQHIAYTIYTMVVLSMISIPLSYLDVIGVEGQYIFRSAGIELCAMAVTANMLLPKVIDLYRHRNDNVIDTQRMQLLVSCGGGSFGSFLKSRRYASKAVEAHAYVRWGNTRLAMNLGTWYSTFMMLLPNQKILVLHPLKSKADTSLRCGETCKISSLFYEDVPATKGENILNCIINGRHHQMQFETASQKDFWLNALKSLLEKSDGAGGAM
ncbi:hypothetical protein HDU67_004325 [Dinochytrium kinnereticum]|nr:hypothetical protein HDU67_004325 [Dinochytrium kinnereticum]